MGISKTLDVTNIVKYKKMSNIILLRNVVHSTSEDIETEILLIRFNALQYITGKFAVQNAIPIVKHIGLQDHRTKHLTLFVWSY